MTKKILQLLLLGAAFSFSTTVSAVEVSDASAITDESTGKSHIQTRIFKLSHVNAIEVAKKFNTMWSGEFGQTWKISKMAIAFEESNTLMITAPSRIIDACSKVLKELDVEANQVYIEARFVELGNTASHKLGIDWSMLGGMTANLQLGGGIQSTHIGDSVRSYTRELNGKTDGRTDKTSYTLSSNVINEDGTTSDSKFRNDGGVTYFNGTLNFSQMSMTLRALDSTEDVKIFSNPKIIVSSGRKATVDMTTKFPNVQIAAKRTISSGAESLDLDMKMASIPGEDKMLFAKEAFFSWGISLEVTPRIGTNGLINVTIVPTISSLDTSLGGGGFISVSDNSEDGATYSSRFPIIEVQRLITEFNMASGSTAVIGGLSRTTERQEDTGIPFLRHIPFIGSWLFSSKIRVKEQKEIIVFVTVGLVEPKNMKKDVGLPKNAILGRQYTKGQKLEPGDRTDKNREGFESLDMRSLEEQARDPLKTHTEKSGFNLLDYLSFGNSHETKKEQEK